ncbi:MAG: EAL domain-containing protein, partial [Campylobacterota bacterium]|nr:EAL domain-containing protein [Campylobacterota bacterium]
EKKYTQELEADIKNKVDEIEEQRKYLQSIIDGVEDPIMVIGEDYTIHLMNSSIRQKLNTSVVADPDHPKCYEILHHRSTPCDGHEYPCPLQDVMESKNNMTVVHSHRGLDGNKHYMELSVSPLFDKEKNCRGVIEVARDITTHLEIQDELREQKISLDFQAHHDALTGLPNRIYFNDRLHQGIENARRHGTMLALFFIDLDQFKHINDSLGHEIGDRVLQVVADRLRARIRKEDTLARLGGDEFTIIMEELKRVQDASLLAQKILKVLREAIHIEDHMLYITCSIGISLYPQDDLNAHNLLKYADTAMYKAKEEGRNSFQFYSAEMTKQAFERIVMKTSLRQALDNEELVVYYQPQVDVNTGKLTGMEALVRWRHPTRGLVSPSEFIPLAEETELIIEIDQWVMRIAMQQVKEWYQEGLEPGMLALNFEMKQLDHDDFIQILQKSMADIGFRPEWLELEVAEGKLMQKPEEAIVKLRQISDIGIQIVIDNFGTGYSSLAYLKRLPVHKLKIDRAFIREIPEDEESAAIVKAIIVLAKSLNLDIVAEGVETEVQKEFLFHNGCKKIQGYYHGQPKPAEEIEKMLKK